MIETEKSRLARGVSTVGIAFVAIVFIVALAGASFYLIGQTSTTTSQSRASSSTLEINSYSTKTTNANDLSLELSLNFSNSVNQTLSIGISVFNSLNNQNNVSASSDWSLGSSIGEGFGPCTFDNQPYQIAVYQGNYGFGNISQSLQPLQVVNPNQPFICPAIYSYHWYLFSPSSDSATYFSCLGNNYSSCSNARFPTVFSESFGTAGFYQHSNSTAFVLFGGGYTVVAEDEWGDLVILHFTANVSSVSLTSITTSNTWCSTMANTSIILCHTTTNVSTSSSFCNYLDTFCTNFTCAYTSANTTTSTSTITELNRTTVETITEGFSETC